jgi:hypothetical protein
MHQAHSGCGRFFFTIGVIDQQDGLAMRLKRLS